MSWTEHVIWWHVYPLGFVGAPIREPDDDGPHHRARPFISWLDHVAELGANGLLLGPIFDSTTHGYDTEDFFRIDPRLGDDEDFEILITQAHERGIRVCLDGVFNHVSERHPYVLDALANGPGSRYSDWFRIDWDAPDGPRPENFEGHGSLVALNHTNPEVREYVAQVIEYWSARGVDAWRLDAAYSVDPAFWAAILPAARERHPHLWFLGEVIHGDYPALVEASAYDSVTQYELWKAIWSSLKEENFFELDHALQRHNEFLTAFVPNTFVGNHDVTRIATQVGHEKTTLALVLLMTVGGVPSIYAGDELGYEGLKEERWGGDDAIRPEFPRNPPEGGPTYHTHQALVSIRRRYPWLYAARTETLELTNTRYVYKVSDGAHSLVVELDVTEGASASVTEGATVLFGA